MTLFHRLHASLSERARRLADAARREPSARHRYKLRNGVYVPKRVDLSAENLCRIYLLWKFRLQRFLFLTQILLRDSLAPMSAVRVTSGRWMNGAITAFGIGVIVYFSYHSVAGNHGLFALIDLRERRDALATELDLVRAERLRYERQIGLLDRARLDPDLLEESARANLGYAHPDDLVIFLPGRRAPQTDRR